MNNDGWTPLMVATQKGHLKLATWLTKHGAGSDEHYVDTSNVRPKKSKKNTGRTVLADP
jgi:hypothetical protein